MFLCLFFSIYIIFFLSCNCDRLITNHYPVLVLVFLLACWFVCLFVFFLGVGEVRKISYSNNFSNAFFIPELIVELRIERPWDNELENKRSKAFKLLSDLLKNEVRFISTKRDCQSAHWGKFSISSCVTYRTVWNIGFYRVLPTVQGRKHWKWNPSSVFFSTLKKGYTSETSVLIDIFDTFW